MKTNLILILILTAFLIGCTELKTAASPITSGDVTIVSSGDTTVSQQHTSGGNTSVIPNTSRIALYWENTTEPHPERKPWSDKLTGIIEKDLKQYNEAKDITRICAKYKSLKDTQKIKAIGEFYVGLAYYESSFNPKSFSVDVGTKNDLGSYSVGLFQVSANDSAAKVYKATFENLKTPLMNIDVATEIFRRQLKNTGLLILPNSSKNRYFATILDGNKYTKTPEIIARVNKHAPFCK